MKKKPKESAEDIDKDFDEGKDVLDHFDVDNAVRRIVLDLPTWLVQWLDGESKRQGISRQALIKTWLVTRVDSERERGVRRTG